MKRVARNPVKKKSAKKRSGGKDMQLVQIGQTETPQTISIREMFERMAQKEAEMIREAREIAIQRNRSRSDT